MMRKCIINKVFRLALILSIISLIYSCAPETSVRPEGKGFAPKPCFDCHTEKISEYQKKHVHSPVVQRNCEACHLRHGKIAVLSLKEKDERSLCYPCHKQMASDMDKTAN